MTNDLHININVNEAKALYFTSFIFTNYNALRWVAKNI